MIDYICVRPDYTFAGRVERRSVNADAIVINRLLADPKATYGGLWRVRSSDPKAAMTLHLQKLILTFTLIQFVGQRPIDGPPSAPYTVAAIA